MKNRRPILLVRHAQAEHHVQRITGGWSDTALTTDGLKQSEFLAMRLENELNNCAIHLGSSGLRRAVQTASIIGDALDLSPQLYSALTDLNNGLAAGKTQTEAQALARPPSESTIDWQPYPQAESWRQFFIRVTTFMETFNDNQQDLTILVTHAANIHVIVAWWLGLSVEFALSILRSPLPAYLYCASTALGNQP